MEIAVALITVGVAGVLAILAVNLVAARGARQFSLAGDGGDPMAPTNVFARQRERYGAGACARSGCRNHEGWLCAYRGPGGDRCGQRWCRHHVEFVGAVPYCHRHAGIVRALAATAGTIKAVKTPPAVDDRAIPLLTLIAADVDAGLTRLLRDLYAGRPAVEIAARSGVQEVWVDGVRAAWQRTWGAYTSAGYMTRVYIRAGVQEPPVVQVAVGDDTVFEAVPPWIQRRIRGEAPHSDDRTDFRDAIVESVRRRLEPVAAQLADEDARVGAGTA